MSAIPFAFWTEEKVPVRGDIHPPDRADAPAVVCIHGFKGFKEWGFWPEVARRLAASGCGAVRFNFSHSGIGEDLETFSETELFETGTYAREVEDLRLLLRRLLDRRLPGSEVLDTKRVGLLAHSRGSVSALAVAASKEFPIQSIVLWNPVASILWWDEPTRRLWRERGFWEVLNTRTGQVFRMRTALLEDAERNREKLDPVKNARGLSEPLLVVVASEDESVPAESGRELVHAVGNPSSYLLEVASTGHTFGAVHPFAGTAPALESAIRATLEHFARTLRKAA